MVSAPLRKKFGMALIAVALFVSCSSAIYYYFQYQALNNNPTTQATVQSQTILQKVGTIIQLPSNETPSIARVVDKTKLAKQPFFAAAQNNDWLIIYTKAGEAILYRQSTNKIIAVGPVTTSGANGTAASTSQ